MTISISEDRTKWGRLCAALDNDVAVSHLSAAAVSAMLGKPLESKDLALGLAAQAALVWAGPDDYEAWMNLCSILADCGPEWYIPFSSASKRAAEILKRKTNNREASSREAKAVLNHNMSVMEMKAGNLDLALSHSSLATLLWPERAVFWLQLGNVYARMDSAFPESGYGSLAIDAYESCVSWCFSRTVSCNKDERTGWGDPSGNTRTGLITMARNCIRSVKLLNETTAAYMSDAPHPYAAQRVTVKPETARWRNYPYNRLTEKMLNQSDRVYDLWGSAEGVRKYKTIGIYMEQGLGDQVQILPCVETLMTAYGRTAPDDKILLVAPTPNHRLIQESLNQYRVAVVRQVDDVDDHDCLWIGSLDIPYLLTMMNRPVPVPRESVASANLVKSLKARMWGENDGIRNIESAPGLKIGLCWHGSPGHPGDWARSVQDDLVAGIVERRWWHYPNCRFYSVQRPYWQGQYKFPDRVTDLGPYIEDTLDLAKILTCMDAVVTVDTVVAHLCALLDVPCFIAMPYHPDARWGRPVGSGLQPVTGTSLYIIWQDPPTLKSVPRPRVEPSGECGYQTEPDYACHSIAHAWDTALSEALSMCPFINSLDSEER